jgi:hypothetical protein
MTKLSIGNIRSNSGLSSDLINPRTRKGLFGNALLVDGRLDADHIRSMIENDIRELDLNVGLGFDSESLPFLTQVPNLEGLTLFVSTTTDITVIQKLTGLKGLAIGSPTPVHIDFAPFSRLERVGFSWGEGVSSILLCTTLRSLYLYRFAGSDLSGFKSLSGLCRLRLTCSDIASVNGIGAMTNLEELWLQRASSLTSLDGIEDLCELRTLWLETCKKVGSIDPIHAIVTLEDIILRGCGNIESLKPIKDLKKLKSIAFTGTNVLDGDLSYLYDLPNLAEAYFDNRKHYSAKRENFPPWNKVKQL